MVGTAEQQLQVTARPREHYHRVFPEVFPDPSGHTLIIGAGLSNILLDDRLFILDLGYRNYREMYQRFLLSPANSPGDLSFYSALTLLANNDRLNTEKRIIAAKVDNGAGLPFPHAFFHDIISSNCLFGALERGWGVDKTLEIITALFDHLEETGKLHLFPVLFEEPERIGFTLAKTGDAEYEELFYTQHAVLEDLEQQGFEIRLANTSIRSNRLPRIFQTVTISK